MNISELIEKLEEIRDKTRPNLPVKLVRFSYFEGDSFQEFSIEDISLFTIGGHKAVIVIDEKGYINLS